jgi:Family of unknown function (DUF5677)
MPNQTVAEMLIIHRDNQGIQGALNDFRQQIDNTMGFGEQLLGQLKDSLGEEESVLPILFSFRHILEMLNSVGILVGHTQLTSARMLLRSALEVQMGLGYILEDKAQDKAQRDRRAMAFMLYYIKDRIKEYEQSDPSTEAGKRFRTKMSKDKLFGGANFPDSKIGKAQPAHARVVQELQARLNRKEYSDVVRDYDNLKKKPRNWYNLYDKITNLGALADHLGIPRHYETMYRPWSEVQHGTYIIPRHWILAINIDEDIRIVRDAFDVVNDALTIAYYSFSAVLTLLPEAIRGFNEWHSKVGEFYRTYSTL